MNLLQAFTPASFNYLIVLSVTQEVWAIWSYQITSSCFYLYVTSETILHNFHPTIQIIFLFYIFSILFRNIQINNLNPDRATRARFFSYTDCYQSFNGKRFSLEFPVCPLSSHQVYKTGFNTLSKAAYYHRLKICTLSIVKLHTTSHTYKLLFVVIFMLP